MATAILRIKKHKASSVGVASDHNRRKTPQPHTDNEKEIIILSGKEFSSANDAVDNRIEELKISRIRKDAVVAVEFMLSASPEYFRPEAPEQWGQYDEKRMIDWGDATNRFLRKKYGENLVEVSVHLDEATPHIHAMVVPAVQKTINKRRTKEEVENNVPSKTYQASRLDAKSLFGRKQLIDLQTEYAQSLEHLGISRGLRKSRAEHQPLKSGYIEKNGPVPPTPTLNPVQVSAPPQLVRMQKRVEWAAEESKRINKFVRNDVERLTDSVVSTSKKAKEYEKKYLREKARTEAYKQLGTPETIKNRYADYEEELAKKKVENEQLKQALARLVG